MGPVTPLLAVHEVLGSEAMWIGTPHGPESAVVEGVGIPFFSLPVARLPRRPSIELLALPVTFTRALWRAVRLLRRERPQVIASAGGYTAVPVCLAARFLRIPIWVHQQDVTPLLTNRLTAPLATCVTVAFAASLNVFKSAHVAGNPVRPSILLGRAQRAREHFNISNNKPTVLVFGGGTGAMWLNKIVDEIAESLGPQANIIHLTGRGKQTDRQRHTDHHVREFLTSEMADALALADVVVCRAGLGTITELAALSKAAVMIPLPKSPQLANAKVVKEACVVLHQAPTRPRQLQESIEILLKNPARREELGRKMHDVLPTNIADELGQMLVGLRA